MFGVRVCECVSDREGGRERECVRVRESETNSGH